MAEKILVIDDEEPTVQLIAMLLERRGFEVIKAYRAEEGLRKAYRHQPQMYVIDRGGRTQEQWQQDLEHLIPLNDQGVGELITFVTPDGEHVIVRCCRPTLKL